MIAALNKRLALLLSQVESLASGALEPLGQCEEVINNSLAAATRVMEEGITIVYSISQIYLFP